MIQNLKISSFLRIVIIDSVCISLYFIVSWIDIFVPYSFSIEEFLHHSNNTVVLPVGGLIGLFLLIPLISTNKKILKYC